MQKIVFLFFIVASSCTVPPNLEPLPEPLPFSYIAKIEATDWEANTASFSVDSARELFSLGGLDSTTNSSIGFIFTKDTRIDNFSIFPIETRKYATTFLEDDSIHMNFIYVENQGTEDQIFWDDDSNDGFGYVEITEIFSDENFTYISGEFDMRPRNPDFPFARIISGEFRNVVLERKF